MGRAVNSLGYHPYESSMYSRATNYKKFGFSHFYTLTGPDVIKYQDKIDESPYVSDKSSYDSALEGIKSGKTNKFIQIITMQNHMPYHEWYENNDYTAESTTGTPLGDDEQQSIETYQKGVEITDQATQEFLNELDALDNPSPWCSMATTCRASTRPPARMTTTPCPAPDRLLHLVE